MISCPMPDHDDSTPSFNLWDDDSEGVPQRFGCYGCSARGDVLELIAQLTGLTGSSLARKAEELAAAEAASGPSVQRQTAAKKPRVAVDFSSVMATLNGSVTEARLEGFGKYMEAKGMGSEAIMVYAMDVWDWAPGDRGVVAVPHRDAGGTITGIKYRALKRKWSAEGSLWPCLYGTWRDKGNQAVVLCEGESDTLWAAWALRNEPVDVLGLPSGAGATIQPEWLERVKNRRLFLVFDADRAGMVAARAWVGHRPDALLARLPEDEDLLSSGLPVSEVLARARAVTRAMGQVDLQGGLIVKNGQNGSFPIADFGMKPVRELITEDGPAWEVALIGRPGTTLIRTRDFASGSKMRGWANLQGVTWLGGKDTDVQSLFNWMSSESSYLPLETTVPKAGKVGRSFVGPGFCIGPDKMRYTPPIVGDAQLAGKIHIVQGNVDTTAVYALERLNKPEMSSVILGWICATLMRGKRAPAPPLFISGESGAGKTTMTSTMLGAFGFGTEMALTTTTPYGVDCMVNSCVGFPVWFDEFRGGAREDSMTRLRQLLRDAYFGQPSIKGGMTSQVSQLTEISTWAGIVVSGEMGTHETSHRDRMIMIHLERDGKNGLAMQYLADHKDALTGLGHSLLTFLAARPDSLFKVKPYGPDDAPERLRNAFGFVQAGWEAWKHFRWTLGLHDAPAEPDFGLLANERAESEDPYLEAIKSCEGMVTRDQHLIVTREENGDVILIPGEVVVEAKRLGIELPARAHEMREWLASRWDVEDVSGLGRRRAVRVRGMNLV
jgi:hypothetical protein